MTVADLQALEKAVDAGRGKANRLKAAAERIGNRRRAMASSDLPLEGTAKVAEAVLESRFYEDATKALVRTLHDFMPDLLRLTEMHLLIEARRVKLATDAEDQRLRALLQRLPDDEVAA